MKKALVTGCNGQDGSYLIEFLLSQNYEVWGTIRRSSVDNYLSRLNNVINNPRLHIEYMDMTEQKRIVELVQKIRPLETYNLAAQSMVYVSFSHPLMTEAVNYTSMETLLNAVNHYVPHGKFYQASTSEMFGNSPPPQSEDTKLDPQSPYAKAKVRAHLLCEIKRNMGYFVCDGIAFNHESERRGEEFITRKVVKRVAEMAFTRNNVLEIGNPDAKRDWGYAKEYVEAFWLMMQTKKPSCYVLATGETHSIKELVDKAFECAELSYEYVDLSKLSVEEADKLVECYKARLDKRFVVSHPRWYRPADVNALCGDATKIHKDLGWEPKVKFDELIERMYDAEIERLKNG